MSITTPTVQFGYSHPVLGAENCRYVVVSLALTYGLRSLDCLLHWVNEASEDSQGIWE